MDDEAYHSGSLSTSKQGSERAGTGSKAFQLEAQSMQTTTEDYGDKRLASCATLEHVSMPLDRKAEPKSMNPLQLNRWTTQHPLAIDSPTSDYGSGSFASLEQASASGKEPASDSHTIIESGVLTVGENVEVATEQQSERELMRPDGAGTKRTKTQVSRDKIPRVGDFILMRGLYVCGCNVACGCVRVAVYVCT